MPSVSSSHLLRRFISVPRPCLRDSTLLKGRSSHASRYSTAGFCSRRSTPAAIPHGSGLSHPSLFKNTRRTFVSTSFTRAAIAQRPPSHRTQLVSYPSPSETREEDEDEDGPDVELVPPEEAVLEMTDRAAEVCAYTPFYHVSQQLHHTDPRTLVVQQLRTIARRDHNDAAALRVAVESGGCHGYQYKMELAKKCEPDD